LLTDLEIAKQYPDVTLGGLYLLDQVWLDEPGWEDDFAEALKGVSVIVKLISIGEGPDPEDQGTPTAWLEFVDCMEDTSGWTLPVSDFLAHFKPIKQPTLYRRFMGITQDIS